MGQNAKRDTILTESLSLTGRRWQWPNMALQSGDDPQRAVDAILAERKIDPTAQPAFLKPRLATLVDPSIIADMPAAVARLERALEANESILIYGDYDVDGVCSTTILMDFLRTLGGKVDFFIPDRRVDGYGLSEDVLQRLCPDIDLLMTTDCGITAHAEISLARALGCDVIVVDHHQVPEELPPAVANLNPHRPDCAYPFNDFCAAGVAFMLCVALRRHLREKGYFSQRPEPDVRLLLDLTAVATVADMMPLQGLNRTLVRAGLEQLSRTERAGLIALMQVSRVDPANISAADLGFRIGPRINARGRLSDASLGVELLLESDPDRALEMARTLDAVNKERQTLERATVDDAIAQVETTDWAQQAGLVVYAPDWHPGILGLVASRLARRFHRPTIAIGETGKGSGRSIEGVNLYEAMAAGRALLSRFGGHRQAAGLTIDPQNIDAFREVFTQSIEGQIGTPPYVAEIRPELEVMPEHLNARMLEAISQLAPFGQGNPQPLLVLRGQSVEGVRRVGDTHLKFALASADAPPIDAIAFGFGDHADTLPEQVDVAFYLERNVFRGQARLQCRIEDLRGASSLTRLSEA